MYIITKEKQYYYLTNEEENKKYSLNINLKEIKNEKTNRILKKLPKIRIYYEESNRLPDDNARLIINLYGERNPDKMFSYLALFDKINSLYDSLKLHFFDNAFLNIKGIINPNLIINNFSDFIELLEIEDYPENVDNSINHFPYYLEWKEYYKNLINFSDFFTLRFTGLLSTENSERHIFIIKALKRAKFFPLSNNYNYSLVKIYIQTLVDYYNQCSILNKVPCCENNMLREINETEKSYLYLQEKLDKEKFKANYERHSKAWEFAYNSFIVSIPTEPQDLIIEGKKMHHCVGSYIDRVAENKTYIVFIRKKDNIEMPYITAQVDLNGTLRQYYLAYDKEIVNEEDIEFKEKYQEYLNRIWDLG